MHGACGIEFQFLAQPQNTVVNRSRTRIVLVSPYIIEEFFARNHAARVLDQVFQGLKFPSREHNELAIPHRLHGGKIDGHITKHKHTLLAAVLEAFYLLSRCFEQLYRAGALPEDFATELWRRAIWFLALYLGTRTITGTKRDSRWICFKHTLGIRDSDSATKNSSSGSAGALANLWLCFGTSAAMELPPGFGDL